MAKITGFVQKIFGKDAANIGQVGSAALGTKLITSDPATIQALTAFTNGISDVTVSGKNIAPQEEIMALHYLHSMQNAYQQQEGIQEYNSGVTYYQKSIVKKAGTYQLYGSLVDDNIGNALTDATKWVLLTDFSSNEIVQGFRLTLTSGLPVTTADVTAASTIYLCPYNSNKISLYVSGEWVTRTSIQRSLVLSGLTSGKPYDVFCYDNAGTPTLELLVWTNDTTRATALTYQDGVLVKTGDATRRYIGSLYTTGTTTTEDSVANRYLWNYYNRASRPMKKVDATTSWTYTTAVYRQANGSTSNQLNFIIGVAEDTVFSTVLGQATNSTAQVWAAVAIGLDSTTTPAILSIPFQLPNNSVLASGTGTYIGVPSSGRHFLAWLEYAYATGVCTWTGTSSPWTSGIIGEVRS